LSAPPPRIEQAREDCVLGCIGEPLNGSLMHLILFERKSSDAGLLPLISSTRRDKPIELISRNLRFYSNTQLKYSTQPFKPKMPGISTVSGIFACAASTVIRRTEPVKIACMAEYIAGIRAETRGDNSDSAFWHI
jgi:hypothetical protein